MSGAALIVTVAALAALMLPGMRGALPPDVDARALTQLGGFFFAVFAFLYNARERQSQSRKQHTIKILFDTRLSGEFRQHLERRKRHFPEGTTVDADEYFRFLEAKRDADTSDDDALAQRHSAEAVRSLLNYYEFIALGIATGDLDEDMMRRSVRGIMCNLVADMHAVVAEYRRRDPRTFEHLARLYASWKNPKQPTIGIPVQDARTEGS